MVHSHKQYHSLHSEMLETSDKQYELRFTNGYSSRVKQSKRRVTTGDKRHCILLCHIGYVVKLRSLVRPRLQFQRECRLMQSWSSSSGKMHLMHHPLIPWCGGMKIKDDTLWWPKIHMHLCNKLQLEDVQHSWQHCYTREILPKATQGQHVGVPCSESVKLK